MSRAEQLARLLGAGVAEAAGIAAAELTAHAGALPDEPGAVLAVHPALVPARRLAALLRRGDKPGFVVDDLTDLEEFVPIADLAVPDAPLYLVHEPERGDEMRNWSPKEALPTITERGRTPLTINEGISWLLQEPKVLEPNHCFMTIGSRKPRGAGLDARTPVDLDQWRDRARRRGPARRTQDRLVLGGQPTHLARLRLRTPPQSPCPDGRAVDAERPAREIPDGPFGQLTVTRRRRPPGPSAGHPGPRRPASAHRGR